MAQSPDPVESRGGHRLQRRVLAGPDADERVLLGLRADRRRQRVPGMHRRLGRQLEQQRDDRVRSLFLRQLFDLHADRKVCVQPADHAFQRGLRRTGFLGETRHLEPIVQLLLDLFEDDVLRPLGVDVSSGVEYSRGGKDPDRARRVANRIRAGRVYLNGAPFDRSLPFGGYKQSGNGREFGRFGFEEYLEVKAVIGW